MCVSVCVIVEKYNLIALACVAIIFCIAEAVAISIGIKTKKFRRQSKDMSKLRVGGGEVWEDPTLNEWNPSKTLSYLSLSLLASFNLLFR